MWKYLKTRSILGEVGMVGSYLLLSARMSSSNQSNHLALCLIIQLITIIQKKEKKIDALFPPPAWLLACPSRVVNVDSPLDAPDAR